MFDHQDIQSITDQYERKMRILVEQINDYRFKLSENQKAAKLKAQSEQQIQFLRQSVEGLNLHKQVFIPTQFVKDGRKKKRGSSDQP